MTPQNLRMFPLGRCLVQCLGLARWWACICALLLAMAAVNACGRRTPPMPVDTILPVPSGLVAWQREDELIVAWRINPGEIASQPAKRPDGEGNAAGSGKFEAPGQTHGGLEGFVLRIDRFPLNCISCPPEESRKLALPLHAGSMEFKKGRARYRFPLRSQAATWRFQVAARYGDGLGRASAAVLMDTPASVPAHRLQWEPSRREASSLGRAIRLFWSPRRERVLRTLTKDGVMVKQDRFFRANIFRRVGSAPWPLRPLNIQPLKTGQLTLRVPTNIPTEFQMRLVDQFGNEGPASPSVLIAPGAGKP